MTARVPARCAACRGEGFTRKPRRPGASRYVIASGLERCRSCGGTGEAGERRYLAARRCSGCGRPFSPQPGGPLEHCTWCARRLPQGDRCRRCGGPLERAATGRPPALCRLCSRARRSYAPRRPRSDGGIAGAQAGVGRAVAADRGTFTLPEVP